MQILQKFEHNIKEIFDFHGMLDFSKQKMVQQTNQRVRKFKIKRCILKKAFKMNMNVS